MQLGDMLQHRLLILLLRLARFKQLGTQTRQARIQMVPQRMDVIESMPGLKLVADLFHLAKKLRLVARIAMQEGGQRTYACCQIEAHRIDSLSQQLKITLHRTADFTTCLKHYGFRFALIQVVHQTIERRGQFLVVQIPGLDHAELQGL